MKKCPLRLNECVGEDCALWCGVDECAIKKIAIELTYIADRGE